MLTAGARTWGSGTAQDRRALVSPPPALTASGLPNREVQEQRRGHEPLPFPAQCQGNTRTAVRRAETCWRGSQGPPCLTFFVEMAAGAVLLAVEVLTQAAGVGALLHG